MSDAQVETLEKQLLAIQTALADLRSCVHAGSAASIESASAALAQLADAASANSEALHHYLEMLGVRRFADAARVLRARGEPQQAARLLRLRALLAAIARQRSDLEAFVKECLDVLDVTRSRTAQRQPHGRLLGSA